MAQHIKKKFYHLRALLNGKIGSLVFGALRSYQDGCWLLTVHSWWLYSDAPLGNQGSGIMSQYITQSHYLNTEISSPCPILLMLSTRLGSKKDQFYKSLGPVCGKKTALRRWQRWHHWEYSKNYIPRTPHRRHHWEHCKDITENIARNTSLKTPQRRHQSLRTPQKLYH